MQSTEREVSSHDWFRRKKYKVDTIHILIHRKVSRDSNGKKKHELIT